jgi:hypothetical protein
VKKTNKLFSDIRKTRRFPTTQTKKSKLVEGIIVLDFGNHTKHINALCGQNVQFLGIKVHNSGHLRKLKEQKGNVSNKAIKYFGAANVRSILVFQL